MLGFDLRNIRIEIMLNLQITGSYMKIDTTKASLSLVKQLKETIQVRFNANICKDLTIAYYLLFGHNNELIRDIKILFIVRFLPICNFTLILIKTFTMELTIYI